MIRFLVKRLFVAIPTVLGVLLITFLLLHAAPGDPLSLLSERFDQGMPPGLLEELRREYGLDQPLPVQFIRYVGDFVQGDLGESIFTNRPVWDQLVQYAPSTARLAVAALAVSITTGLVLGVVAAVRHDTWLDRLSIGISLFALSMPQFWFGLMAVLIFSVNLGWFPSSGTGTLRHIALPALVLGIRASASIARLTRSTMLEVLHEPYVVTARAKGLSPFTVVNRHALKNAFIPVVTLIGLQAGYMLGGAVVVESIFNRPGLGTMMLNGILRNDFPVVQGAAVFVAVTYVLLNIFVDLSYAWLDPRVRLS